MPGRGLLAVLWEKTIQTVPLFGEKLSPRALSDSLSSVTRCRARGHARHQRRRAVGASAASCLRVLCSSLGLCNQHTPGKLALRVGGAHEDPGPAQACAAVPWAGCWTGNCRPRTCVHPETVPRASPPPSQDQVSMIPQSVGEWEPVSSAGVGFIRGR